MSTENTVDHAQLVTSELATQPEVVMEVGEGAAELMAGLSVSQAAAFEVLTTGGSISAAARAANVSRRTLYSWLGERHPFAMAYEQWKSSLAETSRTRLLMIGEVATVQIAKAINQGNTQAALAVVRGMGLLSPPAVGPSLVQLAARRKELEVQKVEREAGDSAAAGSFKDLVNVEGFEEEMRKAEIRAMKDERGTMNADG